MEGINGDWAFTSAVRFRGHKAELVGARFKSDKTRYFLISCQRSGKCKMHSLDSMGEIGIWHRQLSKLFTEECNICQYKIVCT